MVPYYGDFVEDDTVNIPFNTFDSNDPSASVTITDLADSDIHVHKDGSITQAVTDGATVVINFDGVTGNHMITIDTSVHAYYATGSEYSVRIEGTTIDGATVNVWVGSFSIERAGGAIAELKNATDGLSALKTLIDAIPTTMVGTDNAALASVVGALDDGAAVGDPTTSDTVMQYVKQLINLIAGTTGIGTMPSAADPANGINLFEMLRAAMGATFATATDSLEQLQADHVTAQNDLDLLTGADGATLATSQANYAPAKAGDAMNLAADAWDSSAVATTGVNEVVDQNWNEARADHTTAGSYGHAFAGLVGGLAEAGTLSTTQMTTDLTEATDDHYNGRTIVWISGALAGQATDVTAYLGATGRFTYTETTDAPSAGNEFILF